MSLLGFQIEKDLLMGIRGIMVGMAGGVQIKKTSLVEIRKCKNHREAANNDPDYL